MNIHSMTGYATLERDLGPVRLSLELKGVNNRFLDLNIRCADDLRFLEIPFRERLSAAIGRGKVDCRLCLQANNGAAAQLAPNFALVEQLGMLAAQIRSVLNEARPLSVADILRWPGVLATETVAPDHLKAECLVLLDTVLEEFLASRAREGARLADVLRERLARMQEEVARVESLLPDAIVAYGERLASRLREAVVSLDEERIRQEIGVFSAKIDVAEELARLGVHLCEVERVLTKGGAVGKRLDFLMQELNREANTLSAKSVSAAVTAIALELKLLVEQMREQVQNIE